MAEQVSEPQFLKQNIVSLAGTFPEALALLASGRIKTAPLVSHRLPLEGLGEFLTRERRDARQDSIKVLIDPGL